MRRIGFVLLTASLLSGSLGGLFEAEGAESELDAVAETASVVDAPLLLAGSEAAPVRADDGAVVSGRPARAPPLR